MAESPSLVRRSYSHFDVSGNAIVHAGDQIIHHHQADPLGTLTRWLNAPDHTSNQYDAKRKRQPGTALWINEMPAYTDWLAGNVPLLWLHGKAGCCKTVLCSAIIDNVAERIADLKTGILLYFYFSFADAEKQSYHNMLLAFLTQLLEQGANFAAVQTLLDRNQKHVSAIEPVLWSLIKQQDLVHVVIDGLDECSERNGTRDEVLNGVQTLRDRCPSVRLLIASRREADIAEHMQDLGSQDIHVQTQHIDQDIKMYISEEISKHRKLRALDLAVKEEIESVLSTKADGMFQWVFCQLEHIKRLKVWTYEFIKETLHELPETLDGTYDRILLGIDRRYYKQVIATLQWIAFVEQPLLVQQLVEVCVTSTDSQPYIREMDRNAWHAIVDVLSALVEPINRHYLQEEPGDEWYPLQIGDTRVFTQERIKLAHFSVKEYLLSDRIRKSPSAAFALDLNLAAYHRAQCCIAYILHVEAYCTALEAKLPPRSDKEGEINWDKDKLDRSFPLFDTAAKRWDEWQSHAESAIGNALMPGLEMVLLRNDAPFTKWCRRRDISAPWLPWAYLAQGHQTHVLWGKPSSRLLYMACLLHLPRTVARICGSSAIEHDGHAQDYGSALSVAIANGYDDIVSILLNSGAKVESPADYDSPLTEACKTGSLKTVRLLLEAGADINYSRKGTTAIGVAIKRGHLDVAQLLLEAGADIASALQRDLFLLHKAARKGHVSLLKRLIQAGVEMNQFGRHGETPLEEAVRGEHANAVQCVVRAGASVNLPGRNGLRPLQVATRGGHNGIIEILTREGAL